MVSERGIEINRSKSAAILNMEPHISGGTNPDRSDSGTKQIHRKVRGGLLPAFQNDEERKEVRMDRRVSRSI